MEIKEFKETDASVFTAETKFKDLDEWCSLVGMSVIVMVKSEYGKTITGKDLRECDTVGALFNMIESK